MLARVGGVVVTGAVTHLGRHSLQPGRLHPSKAAKWVLMSIRAMSCVRAFPSVWCKCTWKPLCAACDCRNALTCTNHLLDCALEWFMHTHAHTLLPDRYLYQWLVGLLEWCHLCCMPTLGLESVPSFEC